MPKLNDTFSFSFADSRPTWQVTESRGQDTWIARVISDDWTGSEQAFTSSQIDDAIRADRAALESFMDHDDFYRGLPLGSMVHYENSVNQWVRAEVVEATTPDPHSGELPTHGRALLPVALVGVWRDYDLPRRRPNGNIDYPYHARHIVERETFEPNYSNLYEYRRTTRDTRVDPRDLPPIDMSVPDMTREEAEAADLVQLLEEIDVASDVDDTPRQVLTKIRALVNSPRALAHLGFAQA